MPPAASRATTPSERVFPLDVTPVNVRTPVAYDAEEETIQHMHEPEVLFRFRRVGLDRTSLLFVSGLRVEPASVDKTVAAPYEKLHVALGQVEAQVSAEGGDVLVEGKPIERGEVLV